MRSTSENNCKPENIPVHLQKQSKMANSILSGFLSSIVSVNYDIIRNRTFVHQESMPCNLVLVISWTALAFVQKNKPQLPSGETHLKAMANTVFLLLKFFTSVLIVQSLISLTAWSILFVKPKNCERDISNIVLI